MIRRFIGAAAVLTLLLPLACGPSEAGGCTTGPENGTEAAASAGGRQQITVQVSDGMRFEPCSIVVEAGKPVELTLQNHSQGRHDLSLTEGTSEPVQIAAGPGETAGGVFTLQHPGTYSFVCSVPGHAMAGMKGTITAR